MAALDVVDRATAVHRVVVVERGTTRRRNAPCWMGPRGCGAPMPGHNREPIVRGDPGAGGRARLSRRPSSSRHPKAFELASRVAALAPGDLDHVFFCNSGSEAVDTALKIALAYHHVRGEARARG